jgi:hypothetical protein
VAGLIKPYRWRGIPDWNPAAALPPRTDGRESNPDTRRGPSAEDMARSKARRAEFARLREVEGLGVAAATRVLGVARSTGQGYEKVRKAGLEAGVPQ